MNYRNDSSTAYSITSSINRKSKVITKTKQLKSKQLKSIRISNTNMSSATTTTTFTSHIYESLAYTTNNSKAIITTAATTTTTFSTPVIQRRQPSKLSKQKPKFLLNQTIFEPKHSSTPSCKEQKTSTPNFNKVNESKFNQFQQVSRLNTNKDIYYLTSLSSEYYYDLPTMSSRNNPLMDTNKLVSTSTPKSSRYLNLTKSTVKHHSRPNKKLNFNENLISKQTNTTVQSINNVSTVTTVIKCCIKPFKNLIKNNKNIKKLYF